MQAYSLTLWPKCAHFCHFSLYNQNLGKWFLVKIRQNTKPIALLFVQNSPIFATFHSTIKIWEKWFLVKIRQNTKPIALLFVQIRQFLPLFTLQSKSGKMIFGQNSLKFQAYSLTFCPKFAHFCHFSVSNQHLGKWFLVKIGQNTKAIALLFVQNSPIFATFHSTIKIWENDFWSKFAKILSL